MTELGARFTLRLPATLKQRLDATRAHMGVSFNALVLQILWDWLKNNPNNE